MEPGSGEAESGFALGQTLLESTEDLFENAPCGYISALEDGTILKVNGTFLRWLGRSREDLVGRMRFQQLLSPGGQIYHETHYAPLLRMQGSVREIAVEFVRADGTRMPALINSVLRQAGEGLPLIVRTTIFDATERRQYERELVGERERAREAESQARALVETLQASLIPPSPSQIPGLEIAALYRPAGSGQILGGDFYDVFETRRGDWVVFIGDVSGKGPEAARVTAAARYTLRAEAMRSNEPRVVLGALNELLLDEANERYCTVAYACVSKLDGCVRMTICSAGHPLPIVVSKKGVRTVGSEGTLLGATESPRLSDEAIDLAPGESAVFFTDGIIEARRADGEFFGEQRLADLIACSAGLSAPELVDAIVGRALEFQDQVTRDDIAVLVVRNP